MLIPAFTYLQLHLVHAMWFFMRRVRAVTCIISLVVGRDFHCSTRSFHHFLPFALVISSIQPHLPSSSSSRSPSPTPVTDQPTGVHQSSLITNHHGTQHRSNHNQQAFAKTASHGSATFPAQIDRQRHCMVPLVLHLLHTGGTRPTTIRRPDEEGKNRTRH